jgi:Transmembrane Fragile-X-F protein
MHLGDNYHNLHFYSNNHAVLLVLNKSFLFIIMLVDYGIPVINLKIVFLPLLAFEVIILIDNFR